MNGFPDNLTSFGKEISLGVKEIPNLSLSRLRKVFSLMGKGEKIILLTLALLALVSVFVSGRNFYYHHTMPAPANGGSYNEGLLGQPTYINPLLATQEPDISLTNLVFSGLYKYDPNGQLIPDLADGMPAISADQKTYTINLKRNVKWHQGKQLTAADVVFTIQTIQNPDYKSPLRPEWLNTVVTALSDYSVQFKTSDISGPFLQNLTVPILPKGLWENVSPQDFLLSKYNLEAIGSGPYAIKEIKKLPSGKVQEIVLTANDDYFLGRPKLDEIVFKFYDSEDDIVNAFHSREIDGYGATPLVNNVFPDKIQPNSRVITAILQQYQVVFFNLSSPILNDVNVRQALNLATDRSQIISQIFKGDTLLPSSPFVFNDLSNRQILPATVDINQAKALLDQAGWTADPATGQRSKKGNALSLTITTNNSLVDSDTADLLANQWQQLGIKVTVSVLPNQQLTDTVIKPRAFDVLLFPQKFSADPDPFLFWHSSQIKDPGFNLTGFSDPTVDQLITDARTRTDQAGRAADYQQISQKILAATPVLFLDQSEYIYSLGNSLKNVNINFLYDPSQRFDNINSWYMDEARVWK